MNKTFVTYTIAQMMCDLGYNQNGCFYEYAKVIESGEIFLRPEYDELQPDGFNKTLCAAPLWQDAVNWLRDEKKIHVAVTPIPIYNGKHGYQLCRLVGSVMGGWSPCFENGDTYYTTLEYVVEKAIKEYLIKKP